MHTHTEKYAHHHHCHYCHIKRTQCNAQFDRRIIGRVVIMYRIPFIPNGWLYTKNYKYGWILLVVTVHLLLVFPLD